MSNAANIRRAREAAERRKATAAAQAAGTYVAPVAVKVDTVYYNSKTGRSRTVLAGQMPPVGAEWGVSSAAAAKARVQGYRATVAQLEAEGYDVSGVQSIAQLDRLIGDINAGKVKPVAAAPVTTISGAPVDLAGGVAAADIDAADRRSAEVYAKSMSPEAQAIRDVTATGSVSDAAVYKDWSQEKYREIAKDVAAVPQYYVEEQEYVKEHAPVVSWGGVPEPVKPVDDALMNLFKAALFLGFLAVGAEAVHRST